MLPNQPVPRGFVTVCSATTLYTLTNWLDSPIFPWSAQRQAIRGVPCASRCSGQSPLPSTPAGVDRGVDRDLELLPSLQAS